MLHLYRRLLALRHDEPALRIGSFERLEVADGLLAFTRSLDGRSWLVMVNFTDRDVDVTGTVGRPAAITAFADATVVLASSAGKDRNDPPPAMAFKTPAKNEAPGSQQILSK